jgi:hypothetical protein
MTDFDRGPLLTYQVTWRSGHIEEIRAHQVLWPIDMPDMFGTTKTKDVPRVRFHGEFDGHWRLVLVADAADLLSVRLLNDETASTDAPRGDR